MATFVVATIQSTPGFASSNTKGLVTLPGKSYTIWDPANPNIDGDGSSIPITLALPPHNNPLTKLNISLTGAYVFPKEMSGKAYQVVASLPDKNGNAVVVFRSTANPLHKVLPGGGGPVKCDTFDVDQGYLNLPDYKLPFRITGDFTWTVIITEGGSKAVFPTKTRLEFCFARAAAGSGPTIISNQTTVTKVNFGGIYPIAVQRYYLPLRSDLQAMDPNQNQYLQFAARVANIIWAWGNTKATDIPKYDVKAGKASYVGGYGGHLDFNAWMQRRFPECCCFDFAGFVQLGCALVYEIDNNNPYEVLDPRWVFQQPTGYIKQCVIYGYAISPDLPPGYPVGITNPFFGATSPPSYNTNRQPFGCHAWVEVYRNSSNPNEGKTVLDCTTATWDTIPVLTIPQPDTGKLLRGEYRIRHIDFDADTSPTQKHTGNVNDYVQSSPMPSGSCRVNNYAWSVGQDGKQYRIGVWGISAAPIPAYLLALTEHESMDNLRTFTTSLSTPAFAASPDSEKFSNAHLRPDVLKKVLVRDLNNAVSFTQTSVHVGDRNSLVRLDSDKAFVTKSFYGKLLIAIHTYTSRKLALASLVHTLSTYSTSTPVDEIFSPLPNQLGSISLVDKEHTTVYFLQGNHFVSVALMGDPQCILHPSGPSTPGPSDPDHVLKAAESINAHLSSAEVPPNAQLKPKIRFSEGGNLRTGLQKTVKLGQTFTLSVTTTERAEGREEFAVLKGETKDGAVVICAGATQYAEGMTGKVEFFAVGVGETEVAVHSAHRDTLMPETVVCKVKVVPA